MPMTSKTPNMWKQRRMVVTRGWGEGKGASVFNGTKFWSEKMKKLSRWMVAMAEVLNIPKLNFLNG